MRVSEVYASVQGEGPNVGKTTVFVRFGGCNLRCPGWPCDTQHAIDPAFRKEWKVHGVAELFSRTVETAELAGARTITLTGGEPFLQSHPELESFVTLLHDRDYSVEAFTNGTLAYPDWAIKNMSFIMDWKLPGSGEDPHNATRLQNVANIDRLCRTRHNHHAVKFVCKNYGDVRAAVSLWSLYLKETALDIFYGRVWEGDITDAALAEFVMQNRLPWRLNRQEHNYIWPPNERGR